MGTSGSNWDPLQLVADKARANHACKVEGRCARARATNPDQSATSIVTLAPRHQSAIIRLRPGSPHVYLARTAHTHAQQPGLLFA
eukprot:CAMPEP_0185330062 /NCGR_PEP_ID=MMETSP1363-20130426/76556_1 /TAXON_ID=38817 /ORGANISM="Gephyrocapsa oceanica, Strain RCC1303" /LENGTH=84 /DNA_ID=CAMNT_0027928897 /DNA_START=35 /DNA_END=289 /DNA_ORIENTATION=+